MTRALFTDAKMNAACPRCGAQPGEKCVSPRGKHVDPPHERRIWAWQHDPKCNMEDYKINVVSSTELFNTWLKRT